MSDFNSEPSAPTADDGVSNGLPESAQAAVSTARSEAHDLRSKAADQAGDLAVGVREQVRERADDEAKRASSALADLGRQLRTMADRADDDGPAARWVREAGDRSQQLAGRLDEGGAQGLVDDVQRFARRRPGLFLAGAGLAGFVVGRALRNSSGSASSPEITRSSRQNDTGRGEIDLRGSASGQSPTSSASGLGLETPHNADGSLSETVGGDAAVGSRSDV